MMHYCFLTPGSWMGNAGFVRLRELGNQLAGRGVRVSYVVDDVPYNRTELNLHPAADVHFVPTGPLLRQLWARRRVLRRLRPDFVHFLDPSIKSYLALVGNGRQAFVCDWDEWIAKRTAYTRTWRAVEQFLDYWCRRRAAVRIVASRYLEREFTALGYDSVYIPYATYLRPQPDGPSPFAEPTLVYMGNLFPGFDHDLIFAGARILKRAGETPRIAILGDGPDLAKWRAVARDEGPNIHPPGYTSGELLWRHLRHAHALLFPIRENVLNLARCPSKTFAYAQARRPTITCAVGEVVEVLGDRATYISEQPQAWADAIRDVMRPGDRPDVDYGVERHNWSDRCDRLLDALPGTGPTAAHARPTPTETDTR